MNVFIITEGNAQTGYGHLTRCLALYQGFEERRITPVFIASCDQNGEKVLSELSLYNYDWKANPDRLIEQISGADIAIIDSYLAGLPLFMNIDDNVKQSVYLDDTLRIAYPPGIIINGSVGAEKLPYETSKKHRLLLGPTYIPLRKAFWDVPARIISNKISNVLISLGGQDPMGISERILEVMLTHFKGLTFHLIIGFRDLFTLKNKYSQNMKVKLYQSLDAFQMRDLMLSTDLVIAGAGQTINECIRVQARIIPIVVAANQINNIKGLLDSNMVNVALYPDDPNFMTQIVSRLNKYLNNDSESEINERIDGQGVRNIITSILSDGS
ncbi:MAG: hypothetical protein K9N35_01410 [Candidatus Marinimicrobia bacterium]|nr:hypothetical protein [Candidatus Neomarinimicrobiota bacterium]